MRDRKVLLATFGTLGDVHPFVAIAKALRDRALTPLIATSSMHGRLVQDEGIAFVAIRPNDTDIADALGIDVAEVFKRVVRSPFFIIDEIYLRFLSQTFADVAAAAMDIQAIVTQSLLVGANLAAEQSGLPWMRVALSPIHLQSARAPSLTPPLPYVLTPRSSAQRGFNLMLREILRRRLACRLKPVAAFRRSAGLGPSREDMYLNCGCTSAADAVVGLFSHHFAPLEPDHPCNAHVVGFPRQASRAPLPLELRNFLAAGAPPIVFTLGSFAVEASGAFYEQSIAAARRLGRRAILLTGARDAARVKASIRETEHVFAYASHDLLFRHAAAIVHHGGMGTTAEALRSGRPQLVVPFFGDQPDHAARVERLGLGRTIRPDDYDAATAASMLTLLLTPEMEARARLFAQSIEDEDGAARIATMIDEAMSSRATVTPMLTV